jgi:lipopolysaccharide/colanic/teichoic acid biosynthesis glycosyltransferase
MQIIIDRVATPPPATHQVKGLTLLDLNHSESDSSTITKRPVRVSPRRSADANAPAERAPSNVRGSEPRRLRREALHPVYFPLKHFFERVLAVVSLVFLSPLILLLVALVQLTSKGPGLYRQERVGLDGKTFDVFKLRTMWIDAESDGQAKWSQKGDPRITPIGRVLRRTHLDELPQLWNVAMGDMSLTGPRPERPEICDKLKLHIDDYSARTLVKPGITGLAQINLEPDCTIDDVRRKQCLDLDYIRTAGPWLDVRMIAATLLRMVGIRGPRVTKGMGLCRQDLLEKAGLTENHRESSRSIKSLMDCSPSNSIEEFESLVTVQSSARCANPVEIRTIRFDEKSRPK